MILAPSRRRVRAEDLQELAALPHLGQYVPDVFGLAMPLEGEAVHIRRGAARGWAGFDRGQVQPPRGERLEDAEEDAGLVLHREQDRRLVAPGGRHRPPADDEEAGRVRGVVLDAPAQHRPPLRSPAPPWAAAAVSGAMAAPVASSRARSTAAAVDGVSSVWASGRCAA